jgi:carbonic anhydrase
MPTKWSAVPVSFFLSLSSSLFSQSAPAHDWSYTGSTGPSHWGQIAPEDAACGTGKLQSPIDIRNPSATALPPIQFDYKEVPLKLFDAGHTIQVNYPAGSSITVGGTRYELRQFHFHHPSEERIDGKATDMVVHLVHADSKGNLAVVAVLLRQGAANPSIQKVFAAMPSAQREEHEATGVRINASDFLPSSLAYYTYSGSLTTPPCTEGVTWFILKDSMTVSQTQIKAFAGKYPPNARPIQPLGSRTVKVSK